jgi:hypothetical protein
MNGMTTGRGRKIRDGAALLLGGALVAGGALAGDAAAQTIGDLPVAETTAEPAEDTWVVDHVEAPAEIALGTMAVNLWARVHREGSREAVDGLELVLRTDSGEEHLPLEAVDGSYDSGVEEGVVTIDTYAWVRDAAHEWELRTRPASGAPTVIRRGSIRVKPRIDTPDLVLLDEAGMLHPWVGSGAGGFTPGDAMTAGLAVAPPTFGDVDADKRADVVVCLADGSLRILGTRGGGRLADTRRIDCGPGVVTSVLGDLDGDGGSDLVTITTARTLEIRRDLADAPDQVLELPLVPECVALADLNHDGRAEVYVALLGLTDGEIQVWGPSPDDPAVLAPQWRLTEPEQGRGRIRGLCALSAPGRIGQALLVLSGESGEGMLESWVGRADTEADSGPIRDRIIRLEGEPIGAVSGRFSEPETPSWVVSVKSRDRVEWLEVPREGTPRLRGGLDPAPVAMAVLDLDGDGDDDLVTGGEDLRLWINIRGGEFREAGESPYLLEAPIVALASGSLDD